MISAAFRLGRTRMVSRREQAYSAEWNDSRPGVKLLYFVYEIRKFPKSL